MVKNHYLRPGGGVVLGANGTTTTTSNPRPPDRRDRALVSQDNGVERVGVTTSESTIANTDNASIDVLEEAGSNGTIPGM